MGLRSNEWFMGWAQQLPSAFGSRPQSYPASAWSTRGGGTGKIVSTESRLTCGPAWSVRGASRVLAGVLLIGAAVGCTDEQNPSSPCGAPTPAFRFEATTVQEPLPEQLTLRVAFGGAQYELYRLGAATTGEVACCVTVADVTDAPAQIPCGTTLQGDAAVQPNAVVCDLWTNGAVNLTVSVKDQVLVEQTLHAKLVDEASNCGQFETLTAQWVLGEADAGVVVEP